MCLGFFRWRVANNHGSTVYHQDLGLLNTPSIHGRTLWLVNGGYPPNYLQVLGAHPHPAIVGQFRLMEGAG